MSTGDALGANTFWTGSVALTMPLGLPKEFGVSGHVFSDFGSAFGSTTPTVDRTIADVKAMRLSGRLRLFVEIAPRPVAPRSGDADRQRKLTTKGSSSASASDRISRCVSRPVSALPPSYGLAAVWPHAVKAQQVAPPVIITVDMQQILRDSRVAKDVQAQMDNATSATPRTYRAGERPAETQDEFEHERTTLVPGSI